MFLVVRSQNLRNVTGSMQNKEKTWNLFSLESTGPIWKLFGANVPWVTHYRDWNVLRFVKNMAAKGGSYFIFMSILPLSGRLHHHHDRTIFSVISVIGLTIKSLPLSLYPFLHFIYFSLYFFSFYWLFPHPSVFVP